MALNWYNSNLGRAFPFMDTTIHRAGGGYLENLPNQLIVDAGFMVGLESGFISGVHRIWLTALTRVPGPLFHFDFTSDAPGLVGLVLRFTRAATDDDYLTEYVELDESDVPSEASDISQSALEAEPRFSGFITTGQLGELTALLTVDNTSLVRSTDGGDIIEPALVQNLANSYLSSVSIANDDRTRVSALDGCPPVVWDYPTGPGTLYVQARRLHGQVRFDGGYNVSVTQDPANNAIVFSAEPGAGLGQLCNDEVSLFPAEAVPAGSMLLEGGPTCNQVIRTINGLGGKVALINAGPGVSVTPLPAQNTLVLDVNLRHLAVCVGLSDTSEISETL